MSGELAKYTQQLREAPLGTYYISYCNVARKDGQTTWTSMESGQTVNEARLAGAMHAIDNNGLQTVTWNLS